MNHTKLLFISLGLSGIITPVYSMELPSRSPEKVICNVRSLDALMAKINSSTVVTNYFQPYVASNFNYCMKNYPKITTLALMGTTALAVWYLFPKIRSFLRKPAIVPASVKNLNILTIQTALLPLSPRTSSYTRQQSNPNSMLFWHSKTTRDHANRQAIGAFNRSGSSVLVENSTLLFKLRSIFEPSIILELPFDYKEVAALVISNSNLITGDASGYTAIGLNDGHVVVINNSTKEKVQFKLAKKIIGLGFVDGGDYHDLVIKQEDTNELLAYNITDCYSQIKNISTQE